MHTNNLKFFVLQEIYKHFQVENTQDIWSEFSLKTKRDRKIMHQASLM